MQNDIVTRSENLLKGIQEIADFLGIGKTRAYSLIDEGLPVRYAGGCYWAHKQEVEEWFCEKNPEAGIE